MDSHTSICPVPFEQQPINEYKSLEESCFFHWATLDLKGYLTGMTRIIGLSLFLMGPVAADSFPPNQSPGQFVLMASAGASVLVALVLLRLYLGWSYIRDRLFSETVFYEETGWYDGQLWHKPPEEQAKDRLVVTYQIQPVLQRLRRTFGILGVLLFGGYILWGFL